MYRTYTIFDEMMNLARNLDRGRVPAARRNGFVPAVESFEKDRTLVLRAELPGVDPSEVEITVKDGNLVLKGEKKVDRKDEKENVFLRETYHGKFERVFALPEDVNADAIEASYRNGVLEIEIPRAELPQPRKIKVLTDGEKAA